MIHLVFIRPNMYTVKAYDALHPLAFSILAGLTPPEIRISFYDERVEPVPLGLKADAVVMSVETFTAKRAYQIADKYQRNGIPVIMGGFHPTFMPEEALEHADSVVIGDAETVWGDIIEDICQGTLKKIYKQESLPSLEGLNYKRNIFGGKKYAPIYPVQYGRGCKFNCDFCAISAFYGNSFRHRPVSDVVNEIRRLNARYIFFVDDNIFLNTEKAKELFAVLIPLKVRWACQVSIDIAGNDDMLKLMRQAGCICMLIGFESLDPRNLTQMNKTANIDNIDYSAVVQKIKSYGIMIFGTFVFGYDFDTKESFDDAVDFTIKNKLCLANFNPLMLMPGTKIFERVRQEGRLIHERWWLDPDYKYGDAMFIPRNMTPQELTDGCRDARFKFNSYASIIKRGFDFRANWRSWSNISVFIAANLISKKEILNKQGSFLGDNLL